MQTRGQEPLQNITTNLLRKGEKITCAREKRRKAKDPILNTYIGGEAFE